jgi:hypothetical protein
MIEQIDAKIWIALRDHLEDMPGGMQIVMPDETYPANASTAFIVVTDVRFGNERRYMGSAADDVHTGQLDLAVMCPLAWSHAQAMGVAGIIREHFSKDLRLGGLVELIKAADVSTAYRDGAYKRVPVAVSWRAIG